MALKKSLVYILLIVALASAKPSLPHLEYPFFGDHVNFAAPVLPPPHLHVPTAFAAPAPAPVQFLPPPSPLLPAPAPLVPAHAPLLPAPAPLVPAPAPLPVHLHPLPAFTPHALPAPVLPIPAPITKVLPPFFEPVPFVAPSYRAIPGPKTTTHNLSVGYAFPPAPTFAKLSHHHHHNSLF